MKVEERMKKNNNVVWIIGFVASHLLTGCSVFTTPTEEVDIPTAIVEESVTL